MSSDLLQQFPLDLLRTARVSSADRCQTEDLTGIAEHSYPLRSDRVGLRVESKHSVRVPLCFSGEALSQLSLLSKVTVASGEYFLCLCKQAPHSLSGAN